MRNIIYLIFVIGVLTLLTTYFLHDTTEVEGSTRYIVIEVEKGDSIWSIANQYGHADLDIDDFVKEVVRLNHLNGSTIFAGTNICIPIVIEDGYTNTMVAETP